MSSTTFDVAAAGGRIASTNLLLAAVGFATSVVAAQHFGDDGRGALSLVLLGPALFVGLSNFGLPHAALFYASRDREHASSWVGSAVALSAITGTVVGLAGLAAVELIIPDDRGSLLFPARVMMIGVALQPVAGVALHPWLGLRELRTWNRLRVAVALVPLIATLTVVALQTRVFTTYATIHVVTVAVVAVLAVATWWRKALRIDRSKFGRLLSFGAPTALAVIPFSLNFKVDQVFLAPVVSSAELGHYAVAAGWSLLAMPVLNTLAQLALPRFAESIEDPGAVAHHLRFSVLVATLIAAVGAVASPFIVPVVYGSAFEPAGRLAILLVPATAILGLATVQAEVLRALDRPRSPLHAQMASLAVTLAALPWVAPTFGLWGAAGISVVAYSVACIWSAVAVARATGLGFVELFGFGRRECRDLAVLGRKLAGRFGTDRVR